MNRKKILIIISIILLIILFSFSCFYIFYRYRYKINKFKYLGGTITKKDIENNINENYINTITVYQRISDTEVIEYVYSIGEILDKLNYFHLNIKEPSNELQNKEEYTKIETDESYYYFDTRKRNGSYIKNFLLNFDKIDELEQCIANHIDEINFRYFFSDPSLIIISPEEMAKEILIKYHEEIKKYLNNTDIKDLNIDDEIIKLQNDLTILRSIIFEEKIFNFYKKWIYQTQNIFNEDIDIRKSFFEMRRYCFEDVKKNGTVLRYYYTKIRNNDMLAINSFICDDYILNKLDNELLLVCDSDDLKNFNSVTIKRKEEEEEETDEGIKKKINYRPILYIKLNQQMNRSRNNHSITLTYDAGDKFIILKPITHDTWNDVNKFNDPYVKQVFNIITSLTIKYDDKLWLFKKQNTYNIIQQEILDIYNKIIARLNDREKIVKSCFGRAPLEEKKQLIEKLSSIEPIGIVHSKYNYERCYVIVFINGKHIAICLEYKNYYYRGSKFKKSNEIIYYYQIIPDISKIFREIFYQFDNIMDTSDGRLRDIIVPVIQRSLEVGGPKFMETYLYRNITNITGSPYNIKFITEEIKEIKKVEETEETEETEEVEEIEEVEEVKEVEETEGKKTITGVNPFLKFYIDYNHKLCIKSTNNQNKIYVPLKYDDIEKKYLVDMDYIGNEKKRYWYNKKINGVHLANNAGGRGFNIIYPTNHIVINNFVNEVEKKKIPNYMLKSQTNSTILKDLTIPIKSTNSEQPIVQTSLTELNIPANVTNINDLPPFLTELTISTNPRFSEQPIVQTSLTELNIPSNTSNLTNITIPTNQTELTNPKKSK